MPDLQKTGTYLLINEHPMNKEPLLILKPMNFVLGLQLGFPLFALLSHKYSQPQAVNGLACRLLQRAFPELQLICYSQINSISSDVNLPYFTSFI